jgi:DNA-binding response OmpR family regulator
LIEDEPEIAQLIASLVTQAGFVIDHGRSLGEARAATLKFAYDLILLDRRLPDGDGLSLVPTIRNVRPGARILMLTALDTLDDTVAGLDAGADDYLHTPIRGPELIARIRAGMRRPGYDTQPSLVVANISLDLATRQVSVGDKPVELHRRELALLEALMRRANRVTTREAILEEVYGMETDVQQHTIDTLVWRLRRRVESFDARVAIHVARGIGYMLMEATA